MLVVRPASADISTGLTLLQPKGARVAALAEAASALENDVAAFAYNPATLVTLNQAQVSFLHQNGAVQDAYSQLLFGAPLKNVGVGLLAGFYDGGEELLFDGEQETEVHVQRDLIVALGGALTWGAVSLGLSGKSISSEVAESAHAKAFAADVGLFAGVTKRVGFGVSVQNIGSKFGYGGPKDHLPRLARAGLSFLLIPTADFRTTAFFESLYLINEQRALPALGLETCFGPVAVRGGYKAGLPLDEISIGTGLSLGRFSLDYSAALVQDTETQQRLSVTLKWGRGPQAGPVPNFAQKIIR